MSTVAIWMTKQRSTYDFLGLLNAGINFGNMALGFIIGFIDLMFMANR